ncbi:MAG TPA: DUF4375 domain-containing protein [Terriglobales bacterium]|nr:DUF4375 domain-containing protein [Terriglobales bacterium]
MPELKWLDGYTGQTLEQILALEGEYRVDSLVLALEQALGQKAARPDAQSLTKEERVVLAVEALQREVNNGGYGQFFSNSSRDFVPIIVESLRRIGCPQTAEITQKAIDVLCLPHLNAEEIAAMGEDSSKRSAELKSCDELYCDTQEDIAGKLFAFIRINRGAIKL